ncbi:MAG: phosphatidylglycerophosphatase A [Phycisphaerales bacterium]|nr:MAG: phosphatidylglycerophosphatase A [Phycisphaerales bacterium]
MAIDPFQRRPLRLITTFGLGHMRPASGTWGSLPPIVLALILVAVGLGPADHRAFFDAAMVLIAVVFSWACVRDGDFAEARFGKKDPGQVVADETAGQAVTLLMLPTAAMQDVRAAIFTIVLSFFAFRIFDILKPWPARSLQRVPGGWGILIDDLFAGVYAGVAVWLAWHLGVAWRG